MAVPVPAEAGGGRQRALAAGSPVDYMSITSFPRLPEEEAGGAAEGGLRARKEEDAFLGEQDTGEGRRPRPPAAPRVPSAAHPPVPAAPAPPAASSGPGPRVPSTRSPRSPPTPPSPAAGPRGSPSLAPTRGAGLAGLPGARVPRPLVYRVGTRGMRRARQPARGSRALAVHWCGGNKARCAPILQETLCLFSTHCSLLHSSQKRFFSPTSCFFTKQHCPSPPGLLRSPRTGLCPVSLQAPRPMFEQAPHAPCPLPRLTVTAR